MFWQSNTKFDFLTSVLRFSSFSENGSTGGFGQGGSAHLRNTFLCRLCKGHPQRFRENMRMDSFPPCTEKRGSFLFCFVLYPGSQSQVREQRFSKRCQISLFVYCKVKTFKPKPFIHDGKKSTWISNKVRNSMIKRLKVHNIYISKTFERLLALPILNPNFLVQL